ncbi:hypothetical protein A9G28_06635 [Gilliamella sp. Fer1-1]|jgi:hypothetical protein|uniref:hypothetical protein n=1 Tax=Gilliamella sp. Fer1-1 TaxID=3120240 RepID=UPI00080EB2AF|nr:hypothetical protein [Gilliamella apicola]OCG41185.1 hypothetical protein A9G28_06635 [Gilliamella apicola]
MHLEIIYWKLNKDGISLDDLNMHIDKENILQWKKIKEIESKIWIENKNEGWWGAIIVWKNKKPPLSELPKNIPRAIIKRPPDIRLEFSIVDKI